MFRKVVCYNDGMEKTSQIPWGLRTLERVERELDTDFQNGLRAEVIPKRKQQAGGNVLTKARKRTIFDTVLKQFKSPLVYVLLVAGVVTLFLREFLDSIVIFAALLINVVVGVLQEERAGRAFEALKKSQGHFATVVRDGKKARVRAEELVPGDIVVLESGAYVPADLRILEARDLSINEAILTGEWVAVPKEPGIHKDTAPLAEQFNMAWMGTLISSGYGRGVAVETGDRTQVGVIARGLLELDGGATPLQQNIKHIARFLLILIAVATVVIFGLGVFRGEGVAEMLLVAIAIAVATMPEGLPAAVTVVLALGMEAILKRGGLVRNLLAAETLGGTTVILTDKTGTLTEAKMKLATIHTADTLSGETEELSPAARTLISAAVFASDAFVEEAADPTQGFTIRGRPMEKAILAAALTAGISQAELFEKEARIDFLAFDARRRFAGALGERHGGKRRMYISGAPELLLSQATRVEQRGGAEAMTEGLRVAFGKLLAEKSREGMRLLGVAYREVAWDMVPHGKGDGSELLEHTVFLGTLAFADPIREDAAGAIAKVKRAGARVIMVTGDNAQTALTVARAVGIAEGDSEAVEGPDIEKLDDEELFNVLQHAPVFARVIPEQKVRIARVLRGKGEVVAMTGDGVNDAPALQAANIGVAVGSGTEVAKEASDIILLNDSFSIIVAAIEEGRRIIDNLKKIIAYLLSTSFSEIIVIGAALLAAVPLPLLPSQILWANIIEEGFMSFAFAFEKADPRAMFRDPRSNTHKKILTRRLKSLILTVGVITGALLVALYFVLLRMELPIEQIRTIMFAGLTADAIFFTFSLKSLDTPLWRIEIFSNPFLLGSLAISFLLLLGALTIPALQTLLSLVPLSWTIMLLMVGIGVVNLITIEAAKYLLFVRGRK